MLKQKSRPQNTCTTRSLIDLDSKAANNDPAQWEELLKEAKECFGGKMYMTMSEVSTLLGVCTKTLKLHADLGHVRFSRIGHGKRKIRRVFTARNVAMFCLQAADTGPKGFSQSARSRRGLWIRPGGGLAR